MTPAPTEAVFAAPGGRDLRLDLYRPDPAETLGAAVILIHGGGWRAGDRGDMAVFGEGLARQGFVAIAPEYRLLGEAPWPAQSRDIDAAVAWVRANAADLGVDPAKLALQGFSAGGHLALLAAAKPDNAIGAAISLFAPDALRLADTGGGMRSAVRLLGDAADEAGARQASPIHQIAAGFPPTFLLHGADDWLVEPGASLRLFEALKAAGAVAELHIFAGHNHEFSRVPSMTPAVQAEIASFLRRTLIDPEGHSAEALAHNPFAGGAEAFRQRMAAAAKA